MGNQIPRLTCLQKFFVATQFLTRLPVPSRWTEQAYTHPRVVQESLAYFPVVGWCIGASTCFTFLVFSSILPPLAAAMISIGMEMLLTGAFHEDAFADSVDALGGGWTRDQVLEILKDSRHGTYGVSALVIGIGLRSALQSDLSVQDAFVAIPASCALGRWSILWLMRFLPPVHDRPSLASEASCDVEVKTLVWSFLGFSIPSFVLMLIADQWFIGNQELAERGWHWGKAACVVLIAPMIAWVASKYLSRRIGGTTGDFLGGTCFLCLLVAMVVFCIRFH